jgi:branched-chain amino acid transport system permease protein
MSAVLANLLLSVPLMGAFALLGLGVVTTYQASRVLNLAHGAMAMLPAYIAYKATQAGLSPVVAPLVGLLAGAVLGVGVERLILRPLRSQPPTVQTVGTVGVLGILIAAAAKVFGTIPTRPPSPFGDGRIKVMGGILLASQIGMFVTAVVAAGAVFALFRYTDLGLAMRAAAQNRRGTALMGVNPNRTITVAWALAGATAGLAGVLLAAATNLEPYTLALQVLPAYVAALIGGLDNLPGVLVGSVIVGAAMGLVPAFGDIPMVGSLARQTGAPQVFLGVVTCLVLMRRGEVLVAGDVRAEGR